MRCYICNYAQFSGPTESIDQPEHVGGNNSVRYREELKEDCCSYCYKIIMKNRAFYTTWAVERDGITFKDANSITVSGLVEAYQKRKEFERRQEQENKEAATPVPEPEMQ